MIAFTSDFIQKLVFRYHYGEDTTMDGYVRFTLSKAPTENWIDDGRVKKTKIVKFPTLSLFFFGQHVTTKDSEMMKEI